MKKSIVFLMMTVLCVGLTFGLTSCGKHEHSVSNWETVTEASCTAEGLKVGKCDDCGEELSEVIAKLPHEFDEWVDEYAPTCTKEGSKVHTCKNCGTEEKESIAKVPHNPVTLAGKQPTCTEAGYSEKIVCSECETTIQESHVLQATGHSYEDWQVIEEAECEVPGLKKRNCRNCTFSETEQIEALHHEWGKPSAEPGNPGHHISVCAHNSEHTLEQQCSYVQKEEVKADCLSGGYTLSVCSGCDDEKRDNETDALGHQYTGLNDGWVSITVDESSAGHTHRHYRLCTRCNEHTEEGDCELQMQQTHEATCVLAGYDELKCSKCGVIHEAIKENEPATGHSYQYVYYSYNVIQGKHYQKCNKCQATTYSEDCKFNITRHAETCEEDGHVDYDCPVCGQHLSLKSKDKLGHDFVYTFNGSKDNPTHLIKCNRAGCTYAENTTACEMAKASEKLPTCTTDGEVTNICKYCLERITENGLTSTGHDWHWTTLTDTEHTRVCNKCKATETKVHQLSLKENHPATCTEYETNLYECLECLHQVTRQGSSSLGHVWVVENIFEDHHERHCVNCMAVDNGAHDWTECNLCSGCELDALTYKIEGKHCSVTNTGKLRCPTIIIPEYHKVLDGTGGYEINQYQVTAIADSAFRFFVNDNLSTKSVTIPASVETIGNNAFLYCRALREFKIEGETSNLKEIGELAFGLCPLLESFEAPDSLISIGNRAFVDCTRLTEINIKHSDNIKYIGAWAFYNTGFVNNEDNWTYVSGGKTYSDAIYIGKHLIYARQVGDNTTFEILDDTITISANAFDNFENLTKIVLKPGLTTIDKDAFKACKNLKEVEFTGTVDDWFNITFVNDYSSPLYHGDTGLHIDDATGTIDLSDKTFTHLPAGTFRGDTDITKVILPETLTEIGEEAFEGCTSLTEIEFRGKNVRKVGRDAFTGSGVYNFVEGAVYVDYILVKVQADKQTFEIKDGTITVANEAFMDCASLTSVVIDAATKYVGVNAFKGCSSMQQITFESTSSWLIYLEGSIGRGFNSSELVWDFLKRYNGEWIRLS